MGLRGLSHSIVARVREIILVGAVAGTQQSLNTWHHYLSTQSALGIHGLLIHGFNQPLIKYIPPKIQKFPKSKLKFAALQ